MLMDRLKLIGWGIVAETPVEFEAGSLCATGHGCGDVQMLIFNEL